MDIINYMHTLGQQARKASRALARASTKDKNTALLAIAAEIRANKAELQQRNALDVTAGKEKGLDAALLDRLALTRGYPEMIRVDNGPEFISGVFKLWANKHGILLHYIQPGKPAQNGLVERFNRTYREEVLDMNLFGHLHEVPIQRGIPAGRRPEISHTTMFQNAKPSRLSRVS